MQNWGLTLSYTRLSKKFDLSFVTLSWGFLYIVWPSVLSLNSLKIHKTKVAKNICIQEKFIPRLTFNPGLALTGFQRTRPCLQQVNLTRAPRSNRKPALNQLWTSKRHVTLMSSKLEPAIWSHITGQRIPVFETCQLTIKRISNIKEGG